MITSEQLEDYCQRLARYINSLPQEKLYQGIVDSPFMEKLRAVQLDLGIVVLLLENKNGKTIDRIALSNTDMAKGAVNVSIKPFHEIKIPVGHNNNIIAQVVSTGKTQATGDWQYLFVPEMSAEDARINQAAAGIGCSVVTPISAGKKQGALIFSFYQPISHLDELHYNFVKDFSKIVSQTLSR